jgi:hypothetical protein
MRSRRITAFGWTLVLSLWATPIPAGAQASRGGIAGTVRDATGAVLPGVTVEATSPALIEKVRSVVTDSTGEYKIVELPPGLYTVTFSLSGFSTLKREGIQLTSDFTANVSVDMRVGEVAETITVSGEAPVVDVQNVRQSRVLTRDIVDALPSSKHFQQLGQLIPGVTRSGGGLVDIGGQAGQNYDFLSIHGGRTDDARVQVDGMGIESATSVGNTSGIMFQDGSVQEYTFELGASTAETETGGIRVNMIPREGSNTAHGVFIANYSGPDLAGNNVTDELRAIGIRDPNTPKDLWLVNPSVGGPIVRDRLWSYTSATRTVANSYVSGLYENLAAKGRAYTPNFARPGINYYVGVSVSERLTFQATPRNKFTGYVDYNTSCHCTFGIGPRVAPEASTALHNFNKVIQATWTAPLTNRLLVEAGTAYVPQRRPWNRQPDGIPGGDPDWDSAIRIVDGGTGYTWGTKTYTHTFTDENNRVYRGSLSYVTGSHAAKFGFLFMTVFKKDFPEPRLESYTLVNGTPSSVTYVPNWGGFVDDPARALIDVDYVRPKGGLFAQDQWTLKRMTINAGLRFDLYRQSYPEQTYPATPIIPVPRTYAALEQARWQDVSPRLALAYDVFGNGKTALKGSASKYVGVSMTVNGPGRQAFGTTDTRRWTDANGNFVVDGDPTNPAANGELGPRTNGLFGTNAPPQRFDSDWYGWGKRPGNNWEFSAGAQHQLVPGVSVAVSYFWRVFTNFQVTNNTALMAADFDPFCVTTPVDSRLPGGGGQQVCGLFDVTPSKVGLNDPVVSLASKFGGQSNHWDGVDITMNARLRSGVQLQGGLSGGKSMSDSCALAQNFPQVIAATDLQVSSASLGAFAGTTGATNAAQFCDLETPYRWQAKAFGVYPLPWDFQVSATFQSYPGPLVNGFAVFTSAQVAQSLGRPLSSASSIRVNIIRPGTLFGDRTNQVDLRLAKIFKLGRIRTQAMVDLYNALNANDVVSYNDTYGTNGATWQLPTGIMPPRLAKFAVQVDF